VFELRRAAENISYLHDDLHNHIKMIALTKKKLKLFSGILSMICVIIIFTTKSFTSTVAWAAIFAVIMSPIRYLYYKQLTLKKEKRDFLISELAGFTLFVIAITLFIYFKR
jgi:predicted PurR-regulated permease PerM